MTHVDPTRACRRGCPQRVTGHAGQDYRYGYSDLSEITGATPAGCARCAFRPGCWDTRVSARVENTMYVVTPYPERPLRLHLTREG